MMLRNIPIYIFSVLILFFSIMAKADSVSDIRPVNDVWNFGRVQKGNTKEKAFILQNFGKAEVAIDKVHSCCGYVVQDVSAWKLGPGEKSEITIISDTSRKSPGLDKKEVTIIFEDPEKTTLKIPITSYIR
jgi:uncharacterized protein DUF1573